MTKQYTGYTKEYVCNKFYDHIRKNFKFQSDAANYYEVTPQFITSIIKEVAPPNEKMLEDIGFERKNGFVRVKK